MDLLQKLLQSRAQQIKATQLHKKPSEVEPAGQTIHVKVECPPAPPVPLGPDDVWERLQNGETVPLVRTRPSSQSTLQLTLDAAHNRLVVERTRWSGQMSRPAPQGRGQVVLETKMTNCQSSRCYLRMPKDQADLDRLISNAW